MADTRVASPSFVVTRVQCRPIVRSGPGIRRLSTHAACLASVFEHRIRERERASQATNDERRISRYAHAGVERNVPTDEAHARGALPSRGGSERYAARRSTLGHLSECTLRRERTSATTRSALLVLLGVLSLPAANHPSVRSRASRASLTSELATRCLAPKHVPCVARFPHELWLPLSFLVGFRDRICRAIETMMTTT